TIGLARRVGKTGRVCATDIRETPVRETLRRARRAGLSNVFADRQSGLDRPPAPGRYDGVLVDAPCSGLGTWGRSPDARWRIRETDLAEKAGLQAQLLDAAAHAVVPGGVLVYSVCTLTRAETTEATRAFMQAHPEFQPDPFRHPLDTARVAPEAWILPDQGPCGGMFIARWRRGK
ncbi:MAG: hypothetical protein U1E27_11645, partial [Kiritimatiellia bacterium]|nr:hypothetical protein [Kiritimatiellia bacterium]